MSKDRNAKYMTSPYSHLRWQHEGSSWNTLLNIFPNFGSGLDCNGQRCFPAIMQCSNNTIIFIKALARTIRQFIETIVSSKLLQHKLPLINCTDQDFWLLRSFPNTALQYLHQLHETLAIWFPKNGEVKSFFHQDLLKLSHVVPKHQKKN